MIYDELLMGIHNGLPRESPGSDECTLTALQFTGNLPRDAKIIDIGCGPGAQTICLAKKLPDAHFTAVDSHGPYLDHLRRQVSLLRLESRVRCTESPMLGLNYPSGFFDLVWAECSAYEMGFARELIEFRKILKQDGYLAITEISWLVDDPPKEVYDYWRTAYSGMRSLDENIERARRLGFDPVGRFVQPDSVWWEPFYTPMKRNIQALKRKYSGKPEAIDFLDGALEEIHLYKKYSSSFGCVFYIFQKT